MSTLKSDSLDDGPIAALQKTPLSAGKHHFIQGAQNDLFGLGRAAPAPKNTRHLRDIGTIFPGIFSLDYDGQTCWHKENCKPTLCKSKAIFPFRAKIAQNPSP